MSENTFIEAYKRDLEREIIALCNGMGHGSAKSFDDYRRKQGRVEGLEDALKIFSDLIKDYIDEESFDE